MSGLAECFAWCALQISVLAAATLLVYAILHRQSAPRNVLLLSGSLAAVIALTLACWSPWPRWDVNAVSQSMYPSFHKTPSQPEATVADVTFDGWPIERREPTEVLTLDKPTISETTAAAIERDNVAWWRIALFVACILAAFGVGRLLMGLLFARRYRRRSVRIDDDQMRHVFDQLQQALGIRVPVDLREFALLDVASTLGWQRPIVLLPEEWRDWSADQRRAVLAHELSHVSQQHFPLWLTGQLAIAPHFYHPLVHWLVRRLRLELEFSADAGAVRAFGDRRKYARALAEIAIGPRKPIGTMTTLGLFMSRPLLMRRISMLRQSTNENRSPAGIVRFVALMTLTAVAIAVVGLRGVANSAAVESESSDAPVDIYAKPENQAMSASAESESPKEVVTVIDGLAENSQTVTSLIQVSRHAPASAIVQDGNLNSDAEWQVLCRTQLAFLNSGFVLQAALRNPAVADLPLIRKQDDPLNWLRSQLAVGFVDASEIMHVSMTGDANDAESMRKIVDAVVQAYMDECVVADKQRDLVIRDSLGRSLGRLQREIAGKYEQYLDLSQELNISPDAAVRDPETELLLRDIAETGSAKSHLELLVLQVRQDYMITKERLKDPSMHVVDVDARLQSDPTVSALNQQLLAKRHELSTQESANHGDDSLEIDRLKREIDVMQESMDVYRDHIREHLEKKPMVLVQHDRELEVATKEFQIKTDLLQQQIASLENSIAEKTEKLMAKSKRSVDLEVKKAELGQLEQIAREMSMKLEMMDIAARAPARIRVIQPAM